MNFDSVNLCKNSFNIVSNDCIALLIQIKIYEEKHICILENNVKFIIFSFLCTILDFEMNFDFTRLSNDVFVIFLNSFIAS